MYKIIFLSLMFALSYSKDLVAGTPWDPRTKVGDGNPESIKNDQLPTDKAEERGELNPSQTTEDAE
jgi:hypothetical protein